MLPLELKTDKNGLLYMEDRNILKRKQLLIDQRDTYNRYYQNGFYRIDSTNDYIIKYSYMSFAKEEREKIMEMLDNLILKQSKVLNVDFPVGYFRKWKKLHGLIVRYYQDGVSLDNIIEKSDIELLGKYYYQDEDTIHNLFILFIDVLDLIYEMFENDIYYTDINEGNIILTNNKVKVIDFDYRFVHFKEKDEKLKTIMYVYDMFLRGILSKYNLNYGNLYEMFRNFEEAKVFTKKLENNVRRGY